MCSALHGSVFVLQAFSDDELPHDVSEDEPNPVNELVSSNLKTRKTKKRKQAAVLEETMAAPDDDDDVRAISALLLFPALRSLNLSSSSIVIFT